MELANIALGLQSHTFVHTVKSAELDQQEQRTLGRVRKKVPKSSNTQSK